MRSLVWIVLLVAAITASPAAQTTATLHGEYVRYELLDPAAGRLRISADIVVTTPGSTFFFTPGPASAGRSDVRAIDQESGEDLKWERVAGRLRIFLRRAVAAGAQTRVRVEFTDTDLQHFARLRDGLSFDRDAGIRRGSVVLPAGYRLTSCNVPAQVIATPDGRLMISVMHAGAPTPFQLRATPGLAPFTPKWPTARGAAAQSSLASQASRLNERAWQDRDIVYFMNDPATNSFSLYHDYTESRPGVGSYINVVRAGSKASNPSALNLDTGEALKVETLRGDEIKKRGLDIGEAVVPETEIVLITFAPVVQGKTTRLRISETYTDPGRYFLEGDELVWDRGFGRPHNSVVLPAGWTAIANSIPAIISTDPDGRQRLAYENNRPDEIQVLIRGRKIAR